MAAASARSVASSHTDPKLNRFFSVGGRSTLSGGGLGGALPTWDSIELAMEPPSPPVLDFCFFAGFGFGGFGVGGFGVGGLGVAIVFEVEPALDPTPLDLRS